MSSYEKQVSFGLTNTTLLEQKKRDVTICFLQETYVTQQ